MQKRVPLENCILRGPGLFVVHKPVPHRCTGVVNLRAHNTATCRYWEQEPVPLKGPGNDTALMTAAWLQWAIATVTAVAAGENCMGDDIRSPAGLTSPDML